MKICHILQPISPQLITTNKQFIPGAKPGDILVTEDIDYAHSPPDALSQIKYVVNEITIENVVASELYIEWQPRSKSGGFAKNHGGDRSCLENCTRVPGRKSQWTTPEGNEIVGYAVYTGTNSFQIQLIGMSFEQFVMESGALENGETYKLTTEKYKLREHVWYGFKVTE